MYCSAQSQHGKLDKITNVVYNGSVSGASGSFTNNVTYTYKNDAIYSESGLVEWDAHNHVLFVANIAKCLGYDISDKDIYRL